MSKTTGILLLVAALAVVLTGTAPGRAQQSEAPKIYAILYERGPSWAQGKLVQEQPGFEGHLRHIRSLGEKGIGAAPLESNGEIAGGLIVLRAASAEEAAQFAQGDPFIVGKVMAPRVFRWHVSGLKGCF